LIDADGVYDLADSGVHGTELVEFCIAVADSHACVDGKFGQELRFKGGGTDTAMEMPPRAQQLWV
jgi:hypothetical protein